MNDGELLEMIWSGAVEKRCKDRMSPLAQLLNALLVVPTVTLVSKSGSHRPLALAEGSELLPGAPLGDVLSEELGIHVPRGAVVLIESIEMADADEVSAAELGRELGGILMSMASTPQDTVTQQCSPKKGAGHGLARSAHQQAARI